MLKRLPIGIVLLALIALHAAIASAQLPHYQLSQLPEQEGLKTTAITNIARDQDGFMWLLSQSLVQRFDGRHTLNFPFNETIEKIYVDRHNRKWVRSRHSISLLTDVYHGFNEIPFDGPAGKNIIHEYENESGDFCIARIDGHFKFIKSLKKFQRQAEPRFARGIKYSRFFGRLGETVFFGTNDSIYRYNSSDNKLFAVPFKQINNVILINQYELLVSTHEFKTYHVHMARSSVRAIDPVTGKNNPGSNHFVLFSGVMLDKNCLLVSSNKGLLEYSCNNNLFNTPIFYFNGRMLENQRSTKYMYRDREGTIFLNHADGIFFMKNHLNAIQYLRNYTDGKEKLSDNDVRNFAEDGKGNIWMATTNGIARLNMSNGQLKTYEPLSRENVIDFPSYRQLLYDHPYLWIGTSGNGVWLFNEEKNTYSRPVFASTEEGRKVFQEFNTTYVWKILKLKDGRFFIAGGGRSFIVHPGSLLTEKITFKTSSYSSRSAIQDSSGRIWHGTSSGLSCLDPKLNTYFIVRDSFPDKRIAAFCEWEKNKMLIGTKGLYEIEVENNRVISFTKKNGIPVNRFIYCMKKDRQGYVWMGTDDGIFRYDPVSDKSVFFGAGDHVQSHAFNSDAAFLSSNGLLFMGGRNGVNYFNPTSIFPSKEKLEPVISSFISNFDDSSFHFLSPPFKIPFRGRDIDFSISAPDFKQPYQIQYRYRLTENESAWCYNGSSERVRINNLDPGNYHLQVSASSDGQTWFDSKEVLPFVISKPWWKTWWFRGISLLIIGLIFWAVIRYIQKKREASEMKRAIEYFAHSGSEHSCTEDILWDIARNCISRLGFEDCVIYLVDDERKVLVQKAAYGDKSPKDFEIANPIEIPLGKGITGTVAETGTPLIINNTSRDERYIVDDERRGSELTVPIIHEGKVIGVIDSEHKSINFFRKTHLKTIQTIASLCSTKISKAIALEAVKKAEAELSVLNSKMMESKFKNLRLQMNPHFLFNILTTIQYLIVSQQTNKATSYLNIFSGFLRSILQYAEDTVVSLQEELRILKMYIELESLCLDETFTWEFKVDETIDQEEVQVPFMLLQPFVENAIHHGLLQKPGEKRFDISITDNDDEYMTCIIEDNGIGRSKAAVINGRSLSSAIHKSKGIDIIKQRLALMQQKTAKKTGIEIEDLFEGDSPAGTRVRLFISYFSKEEI